jgi:hypothetical protein
LQLYFILRGQQIGGQFQVLKNINVSYKKNKEQKTEFEILEQIDVFVLYIKGLGIVSNNV